MGEVDVFQIDSTHELYAHMNVNYVKLPPLPAFDDYEKLLRALQRGDFFTTTGEVLLPCADRRGKRRTNRGTSANPTHFPAGNGGDSLGRWHADLPQADTSQRDASIRPLHPPGRCRGQQLDLGAAGGMGRRGQWGICESGEEKKARRSENS
jgi:hypothetical protein